MQHSDIHILTSLNPTDHAPVESSSNILEAEAALAHGGGSAGVRGVEQVVEIDDADSVVVCVKDDGGALQLKVPGKGGGSSVYAGASSAKEKKEKDERVRGMKVLGILEIPAVETLGMDKSGVYAVVTALYLSNELQASLHVL